MKKQTTLKANRMLSLWIGLFGLLVFLMLGVSPLFERNTTAQSEQKAVEVFDDTLAPESGIEPLSNGAAGYRYLILQPNAMIPAGFEQPNFNDTSFNLGQSAFSNQAGCAPPLAVNTVWNSNTRLIVRKKITLAANTTNVRLFLTADNDIENVWFNGTLIASNIVNNNCPVANELVFNIPQNLLTAGSNNTIAVQVLDRGGNTFFDARVLATVPDPPNPPSCAAVTNGLVAWYKGENNTNDIMNQHNGYPTNVVYEPGRVGQAFSLDGVSDVQIPTNRNLVANQFTVDAWVNPTVYDATFLSRVVNRSGSYELSIRNNGEFYFFISGVSGIPSELSGRTFGGATIPLNQWTHIALTYDGSRVRTFINGRVSRQITGVTGNVSDGLSPFVIGSEVGLNGTDKFDGLIDEVVYFNRALSETELRPIVDANTAGMCVPPPPPTPSCVAPPTNLVSWWKGQGNAFDGIGSNNGTLGSGVSFANGKVGQAFSFNGTNGVTVPTNISLISPNFTVGAWVRPTLYDATFLSRVVNRSGSYELSIRNNGEFYFFISGVSGIPSELSGRTYGGATTPLNQWTHIAISFDGTRVRTFVNGRISRQFIGVSGVVSNGNSPFVIGSDGGTGLDNFDGQIDEVQYFSRALGENELKAIVDADSQGICNSNSARKAVGDFDGDNKSDIAVFRPNGGVWFGIRSLDSQVITQQFGMNGDKIIPADYDGDNKTDFAVFRSDIGAWFILNSATNTVRALLYGLPTDIPVPGDFDGDNKADLAVYRPSTGFWYVVLSSTGEFRATQFGTNGDVPLIGDFDGDNKTDIAVYRPSNGVWYRLNSSNGSFFAQQFGISEDKPTPGDFDGDGKTDLAVFRPSNGVWYVIGSATGNFTSFQFGLMGDIPSPGDYDGDGKADFAVFRNGIWYLNRSTLGFTSVQFGAATDKPIQGAFVP